MGGADFTEKEMKRIVDAGHPIKFKKIRKNHYELETDGKGVCAYLKDSMCTIHNERPNVCRAFPVDYPYLKENKKTGYDMHLCPLGKILTEEDIRLLKNDADKIGKEFCTGCPEDDILPDPDMASNIRRLPDEERKLCIERCNKFKTKEV
jgi:Fe-S-cluster containining protein